MTVTYKEQLIKTLELAFAEDIGSGDATGNAVIPADATGKFAINTREDIIFCGADVIIQVFPNAKITAKDGAHLNAGAKIAEVFGNVREILAKERSALNLIQHLSAISTETAKYIDAIKGTNAKILDTRKTTPGLRLLEKYAVKCGGGENHRMGLYDMVLIKDNHIKAAGGITAAINKARSTNLKIEIECDTIEQVREAIAAKPDMILADNMVPAQLREVVALANGKIPIEASGNINLESVRQIAETGVDYISTSKITVGAKPVDIGLDEL